MINRHFLKNLIFLVLAFIGLSGLFYFSLKAYLIIQELNTLKANSKVYLKLIDGYENLVKKKIQENLELSSKLNETENKISNVNQQLEGLKQDVSLILKLRNLDKELLMKYSKVYFLNENYVPKNLLQIDPQYVSNKDDQYIHGNVLPFLYALLEQAKKDGIDLKIKSAYRSFWEQANIKSAQLMTYGSGVNKFTADQGYSEHQLGTTVDFSTSEYSPNANVSAKTKAYKWLLENAYKYGFILSYPENNKYYIFEPWHWRFVGIRLATKLHNENKYFYELDQREIDEYLISIFDW